jgi:hypothetical protein
MFDLTSLHAIDLRKRVDCSMDVQCGQWHTASACWSSLARSCARARATGRKTFEIGDAQGDVFSSGMNRDEEAVTKASILWPAQLQCAPKWDHSDLLTFTRKTHSSAFQFEPLGVSFAVCQISLQTIPNHSAQWCLRIDWPTGSPDIYSPQQRHAPTCLWIGMQK